MKRIKLVFAIGLVIASTAAAGQDMEMPKLEIDPYILTMESFLTAHPDIRWHREGMRDYEAGRFEVAMARFRRAALYGDKASQAMIASMYWDGVGVEQDRELGYAWMDIAAERMYPALLVMREGYWTRLDEAQRRRALERGAEILAEYGDEVAKPRLAAVMKRERRQSTGTRLGADSSFTRIIPLTGKGAQSAPYGVNVSMPAGLTLTGAEYYASQYWEPEEYWQMHDVAWNAPGTEGRVDVGGIETVRDEAD